MRKTCCIELSVFALLLLPGMAFGQAQNQTATIVVNGQSGKVPVIQGNGRTYVDVGALAQIAQGSLSFSGKQIVLTIPPSSANAAASAETSQPADDSKLSVGFMRAAIEELSLLREWAAPVANAIQNGYPIQESWVNNYKQKAATGLELATTAASTNGDRNALQLLNTEFQGVSQWSDNLVEAAEQMNTAQYSMSPNKLRDDPQSQKLISCWRFLGSMLPGGSFQDDSSCH
jgi:hypothetical protein